ncbi:PREDICTED: WEB family protein At2g17940-like [Camelina sativa]|uniref:WEB family protein At2g17940-like n=1 Tax=Camelina sativa TaxID=90675 RepID=A0ABM0W9D7_CAMSA|nr:PREDICTED: WEB family protein At2g17940-like [Camelina sativa]
MERVTGWRSDRAEIETRAAFGSVKEAVAMFGEKVLAGEIYATRLREIRIKETKSIPSGLTPLSRLRSLTLELDQTRENLTRTLQLNTILTNRIKTLTQELEHGRKEIQHLSRTRSSRLDNPEIEELKFVEQHHTKTTSKDVDEEVVTTEELEKRRLVTFASSPLLTRVMSNVREEEEGNNKEKDFERDCSVKKTKSKRGFAPFMGWFRANRGRD